MSDASISRWPSTRPQAAHSSEPLLTLAVEVTMRSFPVLYSRDVAIAAAFWERLGFQRWYSFPPGDSPGYVSLRRDDDYVAVTDAAWPVEHYGIEMGTGPRAEMFVYVDDVDELVRRLHQEDVAILRPPADMPWGERVATVTDPDGNPVSLASVG